MAPEVRVSGPNNEPIGVLSLAEALRMAGELDVDLVEISPTAVPPVCRLMDYGKFKYQEQKKAAEAKSKQKVIEVKEIKFRPGTDDGDYNIKLRNNAIPISWWVISRPRKRKVILHLSPSSRKRLMLRNLML